MLAPPCIRNVLLIPEKYNTRQVSATVNTGWFRQTLVSQTLIVCSVYLSSISHTPEEGADGQWGHGTGHHLTETGMQWIHFTGTMYDWITCTYPSKYIHIDPCWMINKHNIHMEQFWWCLWILFYKYGDFTCFEHMSNRCIVLLQPGHGPLTNATASIISLRMALGGQSQWRRMWTIG